MFTVWKKKQSRFLFSQVSRYTLHCENPFFSNFLIKFSYDKKNVEIVIFSEIYEMVTLHVHKAVYFSCNMHFTSEHILPPVILMHYNAKFLFKVFLILRKDLYEQISGPFLNFCVQSCRSEHILPFVLVTFFIFCCNLLFKAF